MPSIIRPTDYSDHESSTRTLGAWDPATLKRLVPFLAGQRVIVVTDRGNGHAVEGYVVGIQEATARSDYPHIVMADTPDDSLKRLHRVSDLGEIMLLTDSNARWSLHTAIHHETGAALKAVRQFLGTDFPPGAPYKGPRRWTTTLSWSGVRVGWGESYRDRRWFVDTKGNVREYA